MLKRGGTNHVWMEKQGFVGWKVCCVSCFLCCLSACVLGMFFTVNIWYCSALGANVALFLPACSHVFDGPPHTPGQPCDNEE